MGLLDGIVGGISNLVSSAVNVASAVFPPLGIAASLGNLVAQGLGSAVNTACQTLTQVAGMPKFIAQEVAGMVGKMIDQLTQHSDQGCEQAIQDKCGNGLQDFFKNFSDNVVKNCISEMEAKGGKGKGGGVSWYEALAKALGEALDAQSSEVEALSKQVDGLKGKTGTDAQDDKASTMTKLQAASQKMSFMMSASDNVLKTLGEALGTMARK